MSLENASISPIGSVIELKSFMQKNDCHQIYILERASNNYVKCILERAVKLEVGKLLQYF